MASLYPSKTLWEVSTPPFYIYETSLCMSLLPPFIMYDVSLIISAGIAPVPLPKYDVSLYISAGIAPLPAWPIYDTSDCAN